ncbi:MAG: DUF4129 domain-containing protein [Caldicoprobacterales bacterium]|jgi:hypothetical protein|nr:DUF4129 domain-containing protein [Clostridiales bacterium]
MKDKRLGIGRVLIKWIQGIMELVAFFPVIFTIGILIIPQDIWVWISSLVILYLIGLILGIFLLKKPRYTHFVSELLITLLLAWFIGHNIFLKVLIIVFGFIILDRGIRFSGMSWVQMFPGTAMWIGLIVYLVGGAIYSFVPVFKPYFIYITWSGLAYMIMALFTINSEQLKTASLPDREKTPVISSIILKNNRVLVILNLALVTLVSYFDRLREGTARLVKGLINLIVRFLNYLAELMYQDMANQGQSIDREPMEMLRQKAEEAHWIFKILEKVAMILAAIILIALLVLWFVALYKLGRKLYNYLKNLLKDRLSFQEETGYIDEKESLMGFTEIGRDYMDRFQKWIKGLMEREPRWEDLNSNYERIRFLYRNLILRSMKAGYTYRAYLTPRETGEDIQNWIREKDEKIDDLTSIYDKMRYGQEDVGSEQVQKLAERFLRES